MNIKMKEEYFAPKSVSKELNLESIVCDSPFSGVEASRSDYGEAEEQEW